MLGPLQLTLDKYGSIKRGNVWVEDENKDNYDIVEMTVVYHDINYERYVGFRAGTNRAVGATLRPSR